MAVSLHQAGPRASQPLAWRWYLPECWAGDAARRQQGELGRELFDRLRAWGRPARIVLAAVDFGIRGECRAGLEACSLSDAVGSGTQTGVE